MTCWPGGRRSWATGEGARGGAGGVLLRRESPRASNARWSARERVGQPRGGADHHHLFSKTLTHTHTHTPLLHSSLTRPTAGPPSPSASPAARASSAPRGGATRSTPPSARTSGSRPRTRAWRPWCPSTGPPGPRSRGPWWGVPTSSAWAGGGATWTRPSGGRAGRRRRTRPWRPWWPPMARAGRPLRAGATAAPPSSAGPAGSRSGGEGRPAAPAPGRPAHASPGRRPPGARRAGRREPAASGSRPRPPA